MDGVLADFDRALVERGIVNRNDFLHKPKSEWTAADIEIDAQVLKCMREPGWFSNLPPMPDAKELWAFCLPYKPVVLTAKPKYRKGSNHVEQPDRGAVVEAEKREWITKTFGPIPDEQFICCAREEKKNFIGHTPHLHQILVDDLPANIEEWNTAGGIGIVHKSAEMSIYQLKMILNV